MKKVLSFSYSENEDINVREIKQKKRKQTNILSRISAKFNHDLIRDLYLRQSESLKKIKLMLNHFIIPNIISVCFGIFIIVINSFLPQDCFLPPNCICSTYKLKIISISKEYFVTWILWLLLTVINDNFNKYFRLLMFMIGTTIIVSYYISQKNEENFERYPIYALLITTKAIGNYIYSSKKNLKSRILNIYEANGFYLIMFINYFLLMYAKILRNAIGPSAFCIFFNFYILIFFVFTKQTLINYGCWLCNNNINGILDKKQNFLFSLHCRIALSFFFSFLAAPFLKFSYDNIVKYTLIATYANALVAFYTRINFIKIMITKISTIFCKNKNKLKLHFKINNSRHKLEANKYLSKRISGPTLNIVLLSNCRLIPYLENLTLFGILYYISINLILTTFVFLYMLKRKEALFNYPVWNNKILNILILFLTQNLFENNITNIIDKLDF